MVLLVFKLVDSATHGQQVCSMVRALVLAMYDGRCARTPQKKNISLQFIRCDGHIAIHTSNLMSAISIIIDGPRILCYLCHLRCSDGSIHESVVFNSTCTDHFLSQLAQFAFDKFALD